MSENETLRKWDDDTPTPFKPTDTKPTKRKHSGKTCTPDARLTRLIKRWRNQALDRYVTGNEKNSLRRCAYELERLLKL